jgi:hypothetical protein
LQQDLHQEQRNDDVVLHRRKLYPHCPISWTGCGGVTQSPATVVCVRTGFRGQLCCSRPARRAFPGFISGGETGLGSAVSSSAIRCLRQLRL